MKNQTKAQFQREAAAQEAGLRASGRVQREYASGRGPRTTQEAQDSMKQADKAYARAYAASKRGTALKLSDFKAGDVVILTEQHKSGEERRAAVVGTVDYEGREYVLYSGWSWPGTLPSGSGSFYPDMVGGAPYGLQKVEVVGRGGYPDHRGPRPGDRGYDLMC